jgi:hypothetical protein
MAIFKSSYQLMHAHKGGYVKNPDDPGGETYRGVARKIWPRWGRQKRCLLLWVCALYLWSSIPLTVINKKSRHFE